MAMEPIELSPYIRFVDIASTPYMLELYRGMSRYLSESRWWIGDENGSRIPFSPEDKMLYCLHADKEKKQENCRDIYEELEKDLDNLQGYVVDCCDGFLQGMAGCWYRNQLMGGIGICHVLPEHREQLEQVLRIIQGYLNLLIGGLEDHDDLELVHSVWSQSIAIIELSDLLPRLMNHICTAIGTPRGIIFLINEDGEFYPAYVSGLPPEILKRRTLSVTKYEYNDSLLKESNNAYRIPSDDPLRQWLDSELRLMQFPWVNQPCDYIAIPFFRNQNLIGFFVSLNSVIRPFSKSKKDLVQMLSTSSAAALDNALTVEKMEKRRKALATIHVIHRLIGSGITTGDLLPRIGQLIRQLMKVNKCSIMMIDPASGMLLPSVALGLDPDEVGQNPLHIGEELPGWVVENLNPYLYHADGNQVPPWKSARDRYTSESYLSVALFDSDVEGVITVAGKEGDFNPGDREILVTFAEQAIIAIKSARMHEGERTITVNALKSIANLIENRDPERPGITAYTCAWSQRIALILNVSTREYQNITYASLLHDIGMLRTFDLESSFDELRMKGPQTSMQFVRSLGLSKDVSEIVYHVNEAWNGQGYPSGLKGIEIPLGSRIISVANAYATLLNRWTGDEQYSAEKALNVIRRLAHRSYDPDIVNALERAIQNPPDLQDNDSPDSFLL